MHLVKPSFEIMAAYGHYHLPYSYDRPEELIQAAGRTCYKSEDKAWMVCPTCGGEGTDSLGSEVHCPEPPCPTCKGGRWETSAEKFVDMLRKRGHLAMLEHSWEIRRRSGLLSAGHSTKFLEFCLEGRFMAGNSRAWDDAGLRSYTSPVDELFFTPPSFAEYPQVFAMTVRIICDRGVSHEIVRHRPASYAQESTRYCNYGGGVTFIIPPWVDIKPGEYSRNGDNWPLGLSSEANWWAESLWVAQATYLSLLESGWRPEQARSILPNSLKTEIVVTASLAEWRHIFKLRCDKAAHPQMREIMVPLREAARKLYPGVF